MPTTKDFTETMRAIGYPRLISMENFSRPNFELVADILFWMIRRYDPSVEIHESIETESDRVKFIIDATKVPFLSDIRLNRRSLYAANGLAVKELIKIANLLKKGIDLVDSYPGIGNFEDFKMPLSIRADIRDTRKLANDLTQIGSKIHAYVSKDNNNKSCDNLLMKLEHQSMDCVQKQVEVILDETKEEIERTKKQASHLEADKREINDHIETSKQELARIIKRLESLGNIKPAFMDEYESLEAELKIHYDEYVIRYRNIMYLQDEVNQVRRREKDEKAIRMKEVAKLKKKWNEERSTFIGDEENRTAKKTSSSVQDSSLTSSIHSIESINCKDSQDGSRSPISRNSTSESEVDFRDDSISRNHSSVESSPQAASTKSKGSSTIGSDDIF